MTNPVKKLEEKLSDKKSNLYRNLLIAGGVIVGLTTTVLVINKIKNGGTVDLPEIPVEASA